MGSSGQPIRRFYGHDDAVYRCLFFNNASGIVSCSLDQQVKTWYLTPQAPASPEKPIVIHKTQSQMILTWRSPPAFNEAITAFHIQWRVGIRNAFGNDITTPGDEFKRHITGLVPGTPYQFRVRAVNRMGVGQWSDASASYITDIDVPLAVPRPMVHEIGPHSIGVSWVAPTATVEGGSITEFVVQLAGNGVSFDDNVHKVVSWSEAAANYKKWQQRVEDRLNSPVDIGSDNQSILAKAKMLRHKRQMKLLEKERQKKEAEKKKDEERNQKLARRQSAGGALPETTLADPKKKRRKKKKKQSEDDDDATTGGDSLDTSLDGLEEKDG